MEIPPLLLQFAGSLAAIFALYALSRFLRLGGDVRMTDEDTARRVAAEIVDGFAALKISISRKGEAALVADKDGRVMVIKRHGNRFAGRLLCANASVREEVDGLVVDPADKHFGNVRLTLNDASTWADRINRL